MQAIWTRLADQFSGSRVVISIPVMLDLQLPQPLCSCQSSLEPFNSAIEVILGFVEDLFGLKDAQDALLTLENLFGEEKIG